MSKKIKYILYSVMTFIFIFIIGFLYVESLKDIQAARDGLLWEQFLIFSGSFSFGIILGLDKISEQSEVQSEWNFNRTKFICFGIPCIIITILYLMSCTSESLSVNLLPKFMIQSVLIEIFVDILLGYILITSFDKKR